MVPSDIFFIVTKCEKERISVHECDFAGHKLDVRGFIFPQNVLISNKCLVSKYIKLSMCY